MPLVVRFCHCGCGRTLQSPNARARYFPTCAERILRARDAERAKAIRRGDKDKLDAAHAAMVDRVYRAALARIAYERKVGLR